MITIFIILLLVDIGVITLFTEGEDTHPIACLFFIGGTIAFYHFLVASISYKSVLLYIQLNGLLIAGSIGLWIILGVIWSFYKWYIYLKDDKRYQDKVYSRKEGVYNRTTKTTDPKGPIVYIIPQAVENKERITTWMIYWPFSILGFLLTNPVQRLYRWIYSKVSGVFNSITLSVYK